MDKKIENLKKLSLLNGIPGNEKEVSIYIKERIKKDVVEITQDNLGSVIALKEKKDNAPKVLIAGHMDEVGLTVTKITNEGYLKFQPIGGWFSQVMLAQVWQIKTDKKIVYGVTGVKPPHLIPLEQRTTAINIESMYLDIGVSSKEEAVSLGIKPGDMITPVTEFRVMGNENYLLGKAWDNRIGSAVVMDVLNEVKSLPNELYGVFTVQEEVGLRGAKTASYMVNPDIAIAVDTGVGNDVPGGDSDQQTLGKGPQILIFDAGLIPNRALRELFINTAIENNIPYQEAYIERGRTDAGNMHLAHSGAASISLCIPTRYMHSHTSIIHKEDYLNTVKLLKLVLAKLDKKTVDDILYK